MQIFIPDHNEDYFDYETKVDLKAALQIITDDWIDAGKYSTQTIIDMKDCLLKLTKTKK